MTWTSSIQHVPEQRRGPSLLFGVQERHLSRSYKFGICVQLPQQQPNYIAVGQMGFVAVFCYC